MLKIGSISATDEFCIRYFFELGSCRVFLQILLRKRSLVCEYGFLWSRMLYFLAAPGLQGKVLGDYGTFSKACRIIGGRRIEMSRHRVNVQLLGSRKRK